MKFLCDNCKAKYQIADEKVAGKTVRMKCRKCGHQIEVRAAVTETSVSSSPPRPLGSMASSAPPRPGASVHPRGLATSLSAQKPKSPVVPPAAIGGSALAGAFQKNVNDSPASVGAPAPSGSIELSVTDEWYVAINGVPVGPVRISELRRKAAAGAVTEESLCWQEGLEEWRPIRSIADLAALVREAAQGGNRGSYVGQPPTGPDPTLAMQRTPPPPAAPATRQPAPPRASMTPAAPARPSFTPAAPAARSNVVPLRPAASSVGDDMMGLGSPMAPTAMGPGNTSAALAPAPPPPMFSLENAPSAVNVPVADPFAVPPAPATAPLPAAYRDSFAPPAMAPPTFDPTHGSLHPAQMQPQQRGVPLWFWPILVLALGFGGGVAFLVFRPQPTPAPVVIQMPQAPTATATAEQAPAPVIELAPTPSNEPKKTGPVAARGPAPKAPEEKKGIDLSGLGGGGSPNVGPNGGGGGGPAAGGGLDSAGVERTVRNHSAGVKRTCWERSGGDQKSSVNVTVTANVAPNGSVASTSSSGDDPVVAKCIENQVRTWQFPPPGSSTTINIPFKFVRQ